MKETNNLTHLSNDLITSSYSSLAKENDEYKKYAAQDHAIAHALIPALQKASNRTESYTGYKAVVQALFESGFISTKDSDFNLDQLFNYIYGVKCATAIPEFLKLHEYLTNNDFTDHVGTQKPSDLYLIKDELKCFECNALAPKEAQREDGCAKCTSTHEQKKWNTSGDNYYSAYQFEQAPFDGNKPAITRIIIAENQSPMWAYILTECEFTKEPETLYIIRLKCSYNDKDRLSELLELVKSNTLDNNSKWALYNDTINYGIVAQVKLREMECKAVIQPKHIESALFNIYSGFESI